MNTPDTSRTRPSLGRAARTTWQMSLALAGLVVFGLAFLLFNMVVVGGVAALCVIHNQRLRRVFASIGRRQRDDIEPSAMRHRA
jgi:hypothetical protein